MMHQTQKKPTQTIRNGVFESLEDIATGVVTGVTKNLISGQNLSPDTPVHIPEQETHRAPQYRPEVFRPSPQTYVEKGLDSQIQMVRSELFALSKAMKALDFEIEKSIQEQPVHPGVYHLNYLERLRQVIKMIRQNIEDSRSWLALWSSRKSKKSYWGKYKKHGTTFGLSQERTLSTSNG